MPAKIVTPRPDTLKPLLMGIQTLTNSLLQWTIITIISAAYLVILGWAAIKITRWIHSHSRENLFQDKDPKRQQRMATLLTLCLAILVISTGIWGFTRIWDHLTTILI